MSHQTALHITLGGGAFVTASLQDDLSKLVVIPAAYGVGTWIAAAAAEVLRRDADTRARWKDLGGVYGGAAGFGIWLSATFWG